MIAAGRAPPGRALGVSWSGLRLDRLNRRSSLARPVLSAPRQPNFRLSRLLPGLARVRPSNVSTSASRHRVECGFGSAGQVWKEALATPVVRQGRTMGARRYTRSKRVWFRRAVFGNQRMQRPCDNGLQLMKPLEGTARGARQHLSAARFGPETAWQNLPDWVFQTGGYSETWPSHHPAATVISGVPG